MAAPTIVRSSAPGPPLTLAEEAVACVTLSVICGYYFLLIPVLAALGVGAYRGSAACGAVLALALADAALPVPSDNPLCPTPACASKWFDLWKRYFSLTIVTEAEYVERALLRRLVALLLLLLPRPRVAAPLLLLLASTTLLAFCYCHYYYYCSARPLLQLLQLLPTHPPVPPASPPRYPPTRKYMFAHFPHGIYPMGPFLSVSCFAEGAPGVRCSGVIADVLLRTPGLRHLYTAVGSRSASKKSIERIFKAGGSVGILPGGIKEMFLADRGASTERIYLAKRFGFVKMAMTSGAAVVPIVHFGGALPPRASTRTHPPPAHPTLRL